MRKFIFVAVSAVIAFTVFTAVPGWAEVPNAAALRTVDEGLAKLVEEQGLPSIAVAIVKDGKIVFEKGYGWADKEKKIRATEDTPYAIASITKVLTATAVMKLVEEGKLDLDRPANDYLGEHKLRASFLGDPEAATLRRLGNHSGGLGHYAHWIFDDDTRKPLSGGELIDRYGVMNYQPGQGWYYANLGFGALESVIEQVSGMSYTDYVARHVFKPLGMTHSSIGPMKGSGRRPAVKYSEETGEPVPLYQSEPFGAGEGYGSVHDMARFMLFALKEKVPGARAMPVSEASVDEMMRPTYWVEGREAVGVAWRMLFESVGRVEGKVVTGPMVYAEHGGNGWGMNGQMMVLPEERLGYIYLTNVSKRPMRDAVRGVILGALAPETKEKIPGLVDAPWADWQRQSQRPPEGSIPAPTEKMTGDWKGEILTPEGSTPLFLRFLDNGDILGGLDDYPAAMLANVRKDERSLFGLFRGYPLDRKTDWRKEPCWIIVDLDMVGPELVGSVQALNAPDWIEQHYRIAMPAHLSRAGPEEGEAED